MKHYDTFCTKQSIAREHEPFFTHLFSFTLWLCVCVFLSLARALSFGSVFHSCHYSPYDPNNEKFFYSVWYCQLIFFIVHNATCGYSSVLSRPFGLAWLGFAQEAQPNKIYAFASCPISRNYLMCWPRSRSLRSLRLGAIFIHSH